MDIDGTLANAEHRIHLLPKSPTFESTGLTPDEGWLAFYAEAKNDTINHEIRELNNLMAMRYEIIIITGRPETEREMTEAWLQKHNINYSQLLMRPAGDRRPDTVIKKELLDELRELTYEPLFAVEDRAGVTAMWRENGVRCLQVCEGNY
jgi:uncharacterized HAD superfamily protein